MSAKRFSPILNRYDLGDIDGEFPHEFQDIRLPWKTNLPRRNTVLVVTLLQQDPTCGNERLPWDYRLEIGSPQVGRAVAPTLLLSYTVPQPQPQP